ncbi:hypothetical protein G4B88_030173 [Cannabis sativa]|uniref:Ubiquitin-like protease family profile domain-containing protein n=1 Tax=Cannabis sativa TaxID=3483 RepID=A0A7J6E564_CANSA|nr:hypothetical protein G4B88_030173 [Cannabis sativa]
MDRRSSKNDTSKKIVSYRKGEPRLYEQNATIFGNTVGVKVRHHAPLQYSGWAKIPPEDKKVVYARIMIHTTKLFAITIVKSDMGATVTNAIVNTNLLSRKVLGEGKYGWLRALGPTCGKKISVELSSKHKEIEEERLDKLEKIIEDLRKDQYNNVARIVQENMKIFYESQQGRLLEERSLESPIRIPSMDKQNSFFTQLEPSKEKDQPSSSQKPTKSILHEKLVKANRAQYFRFFHPILALDSCQAQNAMTMADRMEGTEAGQFWLLFVNTRDHWMLAIIDVLRETCYWLDSIGLPPPNKIKSLMAMILIMRKEWSQVNWKEYLGDLDFNHEKSMVTSVLEGVPR